LSKNESDEMNFVHNGFSEDDLEFGSIRDHRGAACADLLDRGDAFFRWQAARRSEGLWPFHRTMKPVVGPICDSLDDHGRHFHGVNFASPDYLGLSSHDALRTAAVEAMTAHGLHATGTATHAGNSGPSQALERRIADYLEMEEAILHPTGWSAGYGLVRGLVRAADHVVLDQRAHPSFQDGARAATDDIHRYRHLDVDHCRAILAGIRARDSDNGILVVTESVFAMDADTPDIARLQEACSDFRATLVVDVSHDLGALGDGRGQLELQGMLGRVDLVVGSFSKTFGANGGFIACHRRSLTEYLRFFSPTRAFSSALSPVQAAVILRALEIVASPKGAYLRGRLMRNVGLLRGALHEAGLETWGAPAPIVAVKMASEAVARLVARRLPYLGVLANLAEYPEVPEGTARIRLLVSAAHTDRNVLVAAEALRLAVDAAQVELSLGDDRRVAA
jgi:glycine C-acetyltransferase